MTTCKKGLLSKVLMAVVLVLMLSMIAMLLVQCGPDEGDAGEIPGGDTTPPATEQAPEHGEYYFDGSAVEDTLTLSAGNAFTLTVKGKAMTGSYTLADGKLTLDFAEEGKANVTATLSDNVVTMTLDGAAMRFYKKVNYTVSFESNGGSSVAAQTVMNGKTLAKPADPTRAEFLFVGWYTDAEFKSAFAFGAQPVTGDLKLYARWTEDTLSGKEYDVTLDANYEGSTPEVKKTTGGKLFLLPELTRAGFEFKGWWFSDMESGDKLSYRYEEGTALKGDVTLYALWQETVSGGKLPAPVVNVGAAGITWDNIDARIYVVTVKDENGKTVFSEETPGTTVNFNFAALAAGKYEITVVAHAKTGAANNSEAVRYCVNKPLNKVSAFEVVDSMLIFKPVENAQKYLITIVCGNADHKHTDLDNGASTTYDFSSCEMPVDGIRFVVTAVAEGFVSSVSNEFVYSRNLSAVEGLRFDEATQTVHWNAVNGAAYYMVTVTCGNTAHNHGTVNNGTATFVDLKNCEGNIVVKVYPVAVGYATPAASQLTVNKTVLATPTDLRVVGTILSWTTVTGATKYEVKIGDTTYEATTNSLDLAELLTGADLVISVRAIGDTSSVWSDAVTVRGNAFAAKPAYNNGMLIWVPVVGAAKYELQVNDGEIVTITDGATAAVITLTKKGANTIKLRAVMSETEATEWETVEVVAYEVSFDSRGGNEVTTLYKAKGDQIVLPAVTKNGYRFVAWYNVPGGPAVNGKVFADVVYCGEADMTLYAYFVALKYTVTYNYGEGGSGDKTTDEVPFEGHYQLVVPTPNNDALTFGGWYSAPGGYGVRYTDENGKSLTPWSMTEGAELYAYWIDEALTFTLTKVNGKDAYMVAAGSRIALLSEVTIPATYNGLPVLMIAGNAFLNCTSLKVLNVPATLEQISLVSPFSGCTGLEAVNVYEVEGNTSARFWSEDGVLFDNGTGSVAVAKLVLMPLAKTGSYTIPDGITELPEQAFSGSKLSEVVIPTSVVRIGTLAFENCTALTSVVFATGAGEQALTIGNKAFSGCTALAEIELPARLESIALSKYVLNGAEVDVVNTNNAFAGCTALTAINVAAGNKRYKAVDGVLYTADGKTLLYCSAATGAFEVPTGTQSIAPGAFIGCTEITEVTLPNTLTLVGECAFFGLNTKLVKVTFAGNSFQNMTLDKYAFRGCSFLEELAFEAGNRVSVIGEGAFYGCTGLETLEIPANVTEIGAEAFRDCTFLATVAFAASEKELTFGEGAFYNCTALTTINLPVNVSAIPGIFSGCKSLQEVVVDPASPYLTGVDGVVFNKDMTEILFFPAGKTGEYTLPVTVTTIANGVFAGVNLDKLTIYNTIAVIGDNAFDKAQLGELVFADHEDQTAYPNAETLTVGAYAFYGFGIGTYDSYYGYRKGGTLTLPTHTVSVGDYVFSAATIGTLNLNEGLQTIGAYAFYKNKNIGTFTLPSTVKVISAYAFAESNVQYLTLKEGLEEIGEYAFYYTSSLYDLTIPASVKTIGAYAFNLSYVGHYSNFGFADGSQLEIIGAHAFEGAQLDMTLTIPNTVTDIGAYAFYDCYYLRGVIFAEGGTEDLVLGSEYMRTYVDGFGMLITERQTGRVFGETNYLNKIVLPARLTVIEDYCFADAGQFSLSDGANLSVTFALENSRLQRIGAYAFYGSNLRGEIVLPASLTNQAPVVTNSFAYDRLAIGAYAFHGTSVTKVTFATATDASASAGVTIGEHAFGYCSKLTEITLPANLVEYTSYSGEVFEGLQGGVTVFLYETLNGNYRNNSLQNIFVPDVAGALYADVDGVLYKTNGTDVVELILCPMAKSTTVTVPATVTKIADMAFYYCESVPAIEFIAGKNEMTIGDMAFYNCESLTELTLPNNVVSLGESVFYGCSDLETLTLSVQLKNFSAAMVDGCSSLSTVSVGTDGYGIYYNSVDGVLFSFDMSDIVYYPPSRGSDTLTIDKNIGANTFKGNQFIKHVIIAEGVTEIGANAFAQSSIESITLPASLTLIGEKAFANCSYLEEVVFAEGGDELLVIANGAFQYVYYLNEIELPARLGVIGDSAFWDAGLVSVTFGAGSRLTTIGNSAFYGNDLVEIALPAGLVSMGDQVFFSNEDLETVTIGEGLVSMGNGVFANCTSLVSVSFPASLATMGTNTFFYYSYDPIGCSSLTHVSFGTNSKLQSIPAGTFAYCTSLTEIVIPASVKSIYYDDLVLSEDHDEHPGAFEGCSALTTVTFETGSQCAIIGHYAFLDCESLTGIVIPTSVSTLGESAFENCTGLTSIVIPESCTNFNYGVFYGCSGLTSVEMNSKATELSSYMFAYCEALTSVTLPATVTKLGSHCFTRTALTAITLPASLVDLSANNIFSDCEDLASVTFLGRVTTIGKNVFKNCVSLANVVLPEGLEVLGVGAFANCTSLTAITLPTTLHTLQPPVNYDDVMAFAGSGLAAYAVANGNTSFAVVDGVLFSADLTRLIAYPPKKTSAVFVIPKEVTNIADGAFAGITLLRQVIFEEGGTQNLFIGANAFSECVGLQLINLPERLVSIGEKAFYSCYMLSHIVLPSTLKEIGYSAFDYCYKLLDVGNYSSISMSLSNYYNSPGYILYYAENYYTATEGASKITVGDDGYVYYIDGDMVGLIAYLGDETVLTIPAQVTDILTFAFAEMPITAVTLPAGLKTIGSYAFYGTALTDIELPNGLESIGEKAFLGAGFTLVSIPESVESIARDAFGNIEGLTIVTAIAEKPYDWSSSAWASGTSVIYGFNGAEIEYEFVTGTDEVVENVTSMYTIALPQLTTPDGMVFMGWYDNAAFEGSPVTAPYYSAEKTTLYAKWMTEAGYLVWLLGGTNFEYAYEIAPGATLPVVIDESGEYVYFVFTATESGTYTFVSNKGSGGSTDTYGHMYDADGNQIASNDDGNGSSQFKITYTCEEGVTYYFAARLYSSWYTGQFTVTLTKTA